MTPPAPIDDRAAPPETSLRLVIGSIATLLLLAALDQTIVSTALPTIVADLGGLEHLSWVVTAYILASTVSAPLYGKLGDLYGRRIMVFISVGLFLLGSLLCGMSGTMLNLILARTVQGLGGGGLFVLALSVVGDVVKPEDRGKVQGMFAAVFSVSSMIGPLIGGWFVEQASWHWIFFVNLPLGLVAVVLFALSFPGRKSHQKHAIDWAGAAALSISLAALTLLCSLGGASFDWLSGPALALGGLTPAAMLAFVAIERRAAEPILPLELFRANVFRNTSILSFLIGAGMLGAVTFLPFYLQISRGVSPMISGLLLAPMTLGIVVSTTIAGRYMRKTGRYRLLPVAGNLILIVAGLALSRINADLSIWVFAGMIVLYGFGMGLNFPVLTAAVQNAVPRPVLGTATAAGVMFRQIGGSLAVAVFGAIVTARMSGGGSAGETMSIGREMNPQALAQLPDAIRAPIAAQVANAISPIYLIVAGLAVLAVIVSLRLEEISLFRSRGPNSQETP